MANLLPDIVNMFRQGPFLVIPIWQLLLLLVLCAVAVVLEYPRLVVVFSYAFFVRWVFVDNSLFSWNPITLHTLFISSIFIVTGFIAVSAIVYQTITHRA